ncbi:uncharacterized [Tachysurus ichikawai]
MCGREKEQGALYAEPCTDSPRWAHIHRTAGHPHPGPDYNSFWPQRETIPTDIKTERKNKEMKHNHSHSWSVLLSRLFLGTDNSKLIINRSSDRGEEVLEGEMQLYSEADGRANTKLTAHLWRPSKAETELHSGNHQEAHQLTKNGPPGEENSKWTLA